MCKGLFCASRGNGFLLWPGAKKCDVHLFIEMPFLRPQKETLCSSRVFCVPRRWRVNPLLCLSSGPVFLAFRLRAVFDSGPAFCVQAHKPGPGRPLKFLPRVLPTITGRPRGKNFQRVGFFCRSVCFFLFPRPPNFRLINIQAKE